MTATAVAGGNALEERVAALEAEIVRLRQELAALKPNDNPWAKIDGSMAGDLETFDKIVALGKAWRDAQPYAEDEP